MMDVIKHYFMALQKNIVSLLSTADSKPFCRDVWTYTAGQGGGDTQVLQNGHYFEKAGVNFSHIAGNTLPTLTLAKKPELAGLPFEAMGVSVVIHPRNPYIPTAHANLRFFSLKSAQYQPPLWWFGGGFDLTPYYGFKEDCIFWHQMAKAACDPFGQSLYLRFKQGADDYFFLSHRGEARGIGGLFFDDFNEKSMDFSFAFSQSVGNHFLKAYRPIFEKRKDTPYGKRERHFQAYRRGRYVEFNLLHDRGTLFGLQSGGRTASILMSLPPRVRWIYGFKPKKNSPEEKLITYFLKPRDWLSETM